MEYQDNDKPSPNEYRLCQYAGCAANIASWGGSKEEAYIAIRGMGATDAEALAALDGWEFDGIIKIERFP